MKAVVQMSDEILTAEADRSGNTRGGVCAGASGRQPNPTNFSRAPGRAFRAISLVSGFERAAFVGSPLDGTAL